LKTAHPPDIYIDKGLYYLYQRKITQASSRRSNSFWLTSKIYWWLFHLYETINVEKHTSFPFKPIIGRQQKYKGTKW